LDFPLKNKIITDCPGMDESTFSAEFFQGRINEKHKFSIPIFIYSMISGTPEIDTYNRML
jgi:hypothetical protein